MYERYDIGNENNMSRNNYNNNGNINGRNDNKVMLR